MMVGLLLFSILAVASTSLFNQSQDSLNDSYHALALQKDLRKTISTMSQELREASPSSPSPVMTSPNGITFQIPETVSGNAVTAWLQISYVLANNVLTRTANGQTTTLGNDIQSVNFIYPVSPTSLRTVQIQVRGSRNTLKRTLTRTETGQVVLRNP